MKVVDTEIDGLKIIDPDVFGDERGWFSESYNKDRYAQFGIDVNFVQDNESLSKGGVFRGLHWQAYPFTQAKLVRVIQGSAIDYAVDIRQGSPTFGKWRSVFLSGKNHRQFFIPRGFAHGFVSLEDNTLFSYKCDNLYNKESERGLLYSDPELHLVLDDGLVVSGKDKVHPLLKEIEPYFV